MKEGERIEGQSSFFFCDLFQIELLMLNCPRCSLEESNGSVDPLCNGERMWIFFVLCSLLVISGGWSFTLLIQFGSDLVKKYQRRTNVCLITREMIL